MHSHVNLRKQFKDIEEKARLRQLTLSEIFHSPIAMGALAQRMKHLERFVVEAKDSDEIPNIMYVISTAVGHKAPDDAVFTKNCLHFIMQLPLGVRAQLVSEIDKILNYLIELILLGYGVEPTNFLLVFQKIYSMYEDAIPLEQFEKLSRFGEFIHHIIGKGPEMAIDSFLAEIFKHQLPVHPVDLVESLLGLASEAPNMVIVDRSLTVLGLLAERIPAREMDCPNALTQTPAIELYLRIGIASENNRTRALAVSIVESLVRNFKKRNPGGVVFSEILTVIDRMTPDLCESVVRCSGFRKDQTIICKLLKHMLVPGGDVCESLQQLLNVMTEWFFMQPVSSLIHTSFFRLFKRLSKMKPHFATFLASSDLLAKIAAVIRTRDELPHAQYWGVLGNMCDIIRLKVIDEGLIDPPREWANVYPFVNNYLELSRSPDMKRRQCMHLADSGDEWIDEDEEDDRRPIRCIRDVDRSFSGEPECE